MPCRLIKPNQYYKFKGHQKVFYANKGLTPTMAIRDIPQQDKIATMPQLAVSLFSSSGIGDLGLKANDISTVIGCELVQERMNLFLSNYPEAKGFCGDIWMLKDQIVDYYKTTFQEPPFVIMATPPCQGMSSNGMGTILRNFRNGIRPKLDERNRLIIPAVEIIKKLMPQWVIFENVPNMVNTLILDTDDNLINIIDYIHRELGNYYEGTPTVVDVADYGVPQHRKRLITVLRRSENPRTDIKYFPESSHSNQASFFHEPWVTLKDVIYDLPHLSAEPGKNCDPNIPLHRVPILDNKKLFWVANTPEGQTALNNQCVNPLCGFQGNRTHGTRHDKNGINRANSDTPLYCEKCGALLPRPYTKDKTTGELKIMKAFTSAYKRMSWEEPASTITQNFQYACSDNKLHPTQNRVLSLYEALIIQTILPYHYSFNLNGKSVSDSLIRDTIGESVPPLLIDKIAKFLLKHQTTL